MKTITTNTGSVKIYSNDILLRTVPKGSFFLSLDWQKEQVVMSLNGTATFFVFPADTTIDGQGYDDAEGLADALSAFSRGGGTGEGVQWDDVQDKPLKELTTPIADAGGLVPVYTQGGQLPVGTPEFPENAVPLVLLDVRAPELEQGNFLVGGEDGNEQIPAILPKHLGYSPGGGNVIPRMSANRETWSSEISAASTALPNTIIVRANGTGRAQITDPVEDLDIVNLRTLNSSLEGTDLTDLPTYNEDAPNGQQLIHIGGVIQWVDL